MRFQDKRVTFGSKITDRIWKDNNGQLICYDCVLSRTGYYDYLESDILVDGDPTKIVKVYRTPEEVFDPVSLASFENKPFCNDHPEEDVTTRNSRELQCGYIRNVRRGEGDLSDCVIADVVVTDQDVIDLILSGEKRQLSLGYDSVIEKDNDGRYLMKKIRGNHLALVDEGRAGCATIRDKAIPKNNLGGNTMSKSLFKTNARLYDEDIIEVEELEEKEPEVSENAVEDDDYELEEIKEEKKDEESPSFEELLNRIAALEERVAKLETPAVAETADEEPVAEEAEAEEVVESEDEDIEPEEISAGEDIEEDNTLLDADEEIEKTEEITKKTDKAVNTYSKFASQDAAVKNTDEAIKQAGIEAWKKRYGIK